MKSLLAIMIALLALAAACGGGSSGGTTKVNEANIDPNLLTTVVLQPSDIPPGYTSEQAFSPPGAEATSFGSAFRLNGVAIASTVVQYPDKKSRDQNLDHLRRGLAKLVGPETAYKRTGSDAAYRYLGGGVARGQASLTLRGPYVISIIYQTNDPSQSAIVTNRDELERFSALVFDRLQKLLADPSSITPIAGAPTFDSSRQPQPVVITETPVP